MKVTCPWWCLHAIALLLSLQQPAKKDRPAPVANPNTAKAKSSPEADADQPKKTPPTARTIRSESFHSELSADEEEAILKVVEGVEEAFNSHDAEKFAELFTQDAEIVNVDGVHFHGRDAIQQMFDQYFQLQPEAALRIQMDSLRRLTPSLIIEQGTSQVRRQADEEASAEETTRYTVIYTKEDGRWQMVYARDAKMGEESGDRIRELDWLIGEWVDESDDAVVATSYRWAENRRFIEGQYFIRAPGYPETSGTLRIGWDPQAKQLRTWTFDASGGFATGLWSNSDDGWMIKYNGVMADGTPISATNYLQRLDDDHLSYESVDRTIGGERAPNGDELVIVRQPPAVETSATEQ